MSATCIQLCSGTNGDSTVRKYRTQTSDHLASQMSLLHEVNLLECKTLPVDSGYWRDWVCTGVVPEIYMKRVEKVACRDCPWSWATTEDGIRLSPYILCEGSTFTAHVGPAMGQRYHIWNHQMWLQQLPELLNKMPLPTSKATWSKQWQLMWTRSITNMTYMWITRFQPPHTHSHISRYWSKLP